MSAHNKIYSVKTLVKHLRKVYLPMDFRVMQMLYAIRILWWGIGAAYGMDFAVSYLDYLRCPASAVFMCIVGFLGVVSSIKRYFLISYVFHIVGTFMFGLFSYSFFLNNSHSVAGANYFIEMAGLVWLTFRLRLFPMQLSDDIEDYSGSHSTGNSVIKSI